MTAITAIYDMPLWERMLYRYLLIPAVRSGFADQGNRFAWMVSRPDFPRPDWGPGRIDPFNPVKFYNLHLPDDCTIGNSDIMPLWDLNAVTDPTRQYSLHWDGLSTDLRETAVAGAIGDGMTYQGFAGARTTLDAVIDFIRLQKPPPSPFSATRGPNDPYHVRSRRSAGSTVSGPVRRVSFAGRRTVSQRYFGDRARDRPPSHRHVDRGGEGSLHGLPRRRLRLGFPFIP
jgi:hypothetical protein